MNFLTKSWQNICSYQRLIAINVQNLTQEYLLRYHGLQLVDSVGTSSNSSRDETLRSLLNDVFLFGVPKSKVSYCVVIGSSKYTYRC